MGKIVSVNLPYPSFERVKEDKKTAIAIREAYAGGHGELKTILQYVYHYFYFKKLGDIKTAEVVFGIAQSEFKHLEVLGELLLKLGIDPIFAINPWGLNCQFVSDISYSKTVEKMIYDDIASEMASINQYDKISGVINDETVKSLLTRITLDEQLHIKALKERLEKNQV